MINSFDSFSWDYNPNKDPYSNRSKSTPENIFDKEDGDYSEIIFFGQLEEALLGVVEQLDKPPIACYSSAVALSILKTEHGLTEEDAKFALKKLMDVDLGEFAPCFLDTSIVK
jgi:hypothetical protein